MYDSPFQVTKFDGIHVSLVAVLLLRRARPSLLPMGRSTKDLRASRPAAWMSKYPPAEPGALGIGPLKAAGLDPKLHLCGPRRKHFIEIPTRYPIFSATVGEQIPLDILRPHLARF